MAVLVELALGGLIVAITLAIFYMLVKEFKKGSKGDGQ